MALYFDSPPLDILEQSLGHAVAWWSRSSPRPSVPLRIDEPDSTLRSMRLLPPLFSTDPRITVWSVVESRRCALGAPPNTVREPLREGRLLYYEPGRNLADGAACAASVGFFDVENAPPWDGWLCFADERFVVSWVPPFLIDRATAGIDVNPEVCIAWAEDVKTPFTRLLQNEGLLWSR